ncbi:hypothetical protein H9X96_11025 [Pedobacter sp. N36a]|uniref:hypothetical protein n=1 Tax=Pedobacter sp. N36a TaxID=2767996 RepID=UPI001657440D|nr:hypothetical protein [Pedobacter sp. N36a]MBC8986308.1 hypothetical protein [Pedobacter sp. N36a]
MRNKSNFFFPILMTAVLVSCLFACKKSDSEYYNYENKIQQFDGTALDYLNSQKGVFDSLLVVLNRLPALKDSLAKEKLTVFAVTNKSFEISVGNLNDIRKRSNKAPIYLATMNIAQLDTMTSRYLVRGQYESKNLSNFVDGLMVTSIAHDYPMHVLYRKLDASGFNGGGPQVLTFSDPKGSIFVRYWQRTPTNAVNIKTNNAIVNIVSPGHDFGFGDFITRINN